MGKKILVVAVLMLTLLAPNTTGASEAGVDVNPEGDEPFTVIERTTPSIDKETWSLTVLVNETEPLVKVISLLSTLHCTVSGITIGFFAILDI